MSESDNCFRSNYDNPAYEADPEDKTVKLVKKVTFDDNIKIFNGM